jgi:tetratricopeptide (TPR) repeat protein
MTRTKHWPLLLAAAFILSLSAAVFGQDEPRATAAWQVKRYDISASTTDRYLNAKANLSLQNVGTGAGARVTLRINEKAEVSAVSVNDSAAVFTKSEEKVAENRTIQRISVTVPTTPPNNSISVTVEYKLKVDENNGLNAISPVGSQFLPLAFWYPTPTGFYSPRGADFAPFKLNVASSETVLSSGTASSNAFDQRLNGQPFFITGNWDEVASKGVSIFLPKGAAESEKSRALEIADIVAQAKTFTASLLGSVTDTPTRIIAVRRGAGFSDAGVTLVDYGTFRRRKVDSQTVMSLAESVAREWLGNAKTVRGEGYGTIREGLARFVATLFIEKQYGVEAAEAERLRQRASYAAVSRRDAPLSRVSPVDDYYFSAVANKGAMVWRLTAKQAGQDQFFGAVRSMDNLTVANLRAALPNQKDLLDYEIDHVTDMNLLAGLPQANGKVALRNLGAVDANVTVTGITDKGERLSVKTVIPKTGFGEAVFNPAARVVQAEVDSEKLYPQTDFSDDVAPRQFNESDPILVIKRAFDKQDFAGAEKSARAALQSFPYLDDARTWLGRSLLVEGKTSDAEKEFRAVLDLKLPSARSLAWATEGLGEIALRGNQSAEAAGFFGEAIRGEAEYGATLAARAGRNKSDSAAPSDETVKAFFAQFDKAAVSGHKTDIDALLLSGEIPRFSGGIAGQAQQWETRLVRIDKIDANTVLAEVTLNIKLLGKDPSTGPAVFALSKSAGVWKLSGVEMFEVH